MDTTKTFTDYMIGDLQPGFFCAALVMAYLGALIRIIVQVMRRDPMSPSSPIPFDMSHLLSRNNRRILTNIMGNILLIAVTVRFSGDIFGHDLTMFIALVIGWSFDKLAQQLNNKNS